MGPASTADLDPGPLLQAELAGWRCGLAADTPGGRQRLASTFARLLTPGGCDAPARLEVHLTGAAPHVRLLGTHGPCSLEDLMHGPEWRRFAPTPPPGSRRYADTVLGGAPALAARDDGFAVLRADLWPLYALLGFLGLMLHEHPVAWLHAAVCAFAGRALVLVGPSGSGKSTLCGALHDQGAAYYGDELAFLELPGYRLSVWPRALYLRPGGLEALGREPGPSGWHEAKPNDPKCVVPLAEADLPCPSGDVVLCFLDGFDDTPAIGPMAGGEAARRLLSGLSLADPDIGRRLDVCAGLVSRYPAWRVKLGRPEATAALLLEQAGGHR